MPMIIGGKQINEQTEKLIDNLNFEIAKLRAQVTTWENLSLAKSNQYRRLREAGEGLEEAIQPFIENQNLRRGVKFVWNVKPHPIEDYEQLMEALSAWHKETNPNKSDSEPHIHVTNEGHVKIERDEW